MQTQESKTDANLHFQEREGGGSWDKDIGGTNRQTEGKTAFSATRKWLKNYFACVQIECSVFTCDKKILVPRY